jgi:hypothetical protein
MIHIITDRATPQQIQEMLEELKTYIKLAVDIRQRVVAGGGMLHADCEAALIDNGSHQEDIWGADWIPESREVRFESLINIRPKAGNRSLTITDPGVRATVEAIVRERFA